LKNKGGNVLLLVVLKMKEESQLRIERKQNIGPIAVQREGVTKKEGDSV